MRNNLPKTRGSLLLELLLAISLLAIILSIGTESVFVSMQTGKISSESDVALGLASEALEATRAIADEKWQNIYDLTKGVQYHPVLSGTKWATSTASELIALNTANYTRDFVVQNVCRDTTPSSRLITGLTDGEVVGIADGTLTTCISSTGLFDPSTQKVTVSVSWQGSGSPVVISDYFLRWKNKVCPQASWAGGNGVTGLVNCTDNTFDTSTNVVAGTDIQLCATVGCI